MSSADAVSFIAARLERVPPASNGAASAEPPAYEMEARRLALGMLCEHLVDETIGRGSTDNVSVVVVLLDPTLRAKPALLHADAMRTERLVPVPMPPPPTTTLPSAAGASTLDAAPLSNGHANGHCDAAHAPATEPPSLAGHPAAAAVAGLSAQVPYAIGTRPDLASGQPLGGTASLACVPSAPADAAAMPNGRGAHANGGVGSHALNGAATNGPRAMPPPSDSSSQNGTHSTGAYYPAHARQKLKAGGDAVLPMCASASRDGRGGSAGAGLQYDKSAGRDNGLGLREGMMGLCATSRSVRRVLLFTCLLFTCLTLVGTQLAQLLNASVAPTAAATTVRAHHDLSSLRATDAATSDARTPQLAPLRSVVSAGASAAAASAAMASSAATAALSAAAVPTAARPHQLQQQGGASAAAASAAMASSAAAAAASTASAVAASAAVPGMGRGRGGRRRFFRGGGGAATAESQPPHGSTPSVGRQLGADTPQAAPVAAPANSTATAATSGGPGDTRRRGVPDDPLRLAR